MSNVHTQGRAKIGRLQMVDGAHTFYEKVSISSAGSTEITTSYRLPDDCLVVDAFVNVTTAAAATLLDVGMLATTSGDANGFLNQVSVATTGIVTGAFGSSTSGSPGLFLSSNTLGALLSVYTAGSTVANVQGFGARNHWDSASITENVVSFTADTTVAFAGDLYIGYVDVFSSE